MTMTTTYCGYIAIVGRPNVGKSTLLNKILQQKISITSRKPQTTRHSILGIQTLDNYQLLYVDTPGIHVGSKKIMNRMMNKTASNVLQDVDVVLFVVEALRWTEEDEYVLEIIARQAASCFLLVNKVDKISDKATLLPWLQSMSARYAFKEVIPLSAKKDIQLDVLQNHLMAYMPAGRHVFADDQVTDRSTKFLCAELLREKIFRMCGDELPYSTLVDIESFKEEPQLIRIHALILVEKDSHKRMIIGNKGSKLKEMATNARIDMEVMLQQKVFLQCWCKVKSGWSDDERLLKHMGYDH